MSPSQDPSVPLLLNLLDAGNNIRLAPCHHSDRDDVVQSSGHIRDEAEHIFKGQKRNYDADLVFLGKQFDSLVPQLDVQAPSDRQDIDLEDFWSAMRLDGATALELADIVQYFSLATVLDEGRVIQPLGASGHPLEQAADGMPLMQPSTLLWEDASEQESRISHWLAGSARLDPFHLINVGPDDDIWQWKRELRSKLTLENFENTNTDGGSEEAEIWSIDDESDQGTDLTSEMSP